MKFFNVQIILILIKFVIMFKLISILLTLIHLIPLAHAELDKNLYTSEERWEKISNFNWKNSNDEPIIEDNDANAYIDLRSFPFVSYLLNTNEVQQFRYWVNGIENKNTKYVFILYPSNDPDNDDAITVYIDKYDDIGYVDGTDWVNVDPAEVLADQWEYEQELNKERIENGKEPTTKIEWFIEPTFVSSKGYIYESTKIYKETRVIYNTWIYILGRDGYQFINLVTDENRLKYINEEFINQILESYVFQEGKSYTDFQEGDEVSSTSAADLVTKQEPELKIYIPEDTLCVDVINSVNKTEFSERDKLIILGVVSGFNIYDYFISEGYVGYNSPKEKLFNDVKDHCLTNPGESLILAIVKVLFGDS